MTEHDSENALLTILDDWAKMPGWRIREAAALFLGLDPEQRDTCIKCRQFRMLHRRILRSHTMGLLKSPQTPQDFISWAKENSITVPDLLITAVSRTGKIRNWKAEAMKLRKSIKKSESKVSEVESEFEEEPKARHSLSHILYFIASQKYHYKSGNNTAAGNIFRAAQKSGIFDFPSEQTVRKWLQKAASQVGKQYEK